MQPTIRIDRVTLTVRAEPQHLYSLDNLFSNHRAQGEVSLCLQREAPQCEKHQLNRTETSPQSVTVGQNQMEESSAHTSCKQKTEKQKGDTVVK